MSVQIHFSTEECKGCQLCEQACPKHLISMESTTNGKGYNPAYCTDEAACIGCGSCAKMCPDSVISIYKTQERS